MIDAVKHPLFVGGRIIAFAKEHLSGRWEEGVVESNDFVGTAEVGVERNELGFHITHIVVDVLQQAVVATTESVDTLLHIAHQQAAVALRKVAQQQRLEVLPLNLRRVLKFIYQDVRISRTCLFKHKGRIHTFHQVVEQFRCLCQHEVSFFLVHLFDAIAGLIEQTKWI